MNILENLFDPPNKYRPMPFWSWNDRLDSAETARQIGIMDEAGLGGYFMHARGGLLTEYMGKEWFENIKTGVCEGEKRNMSPWAYDENGWPSGFGDGKVNGLSEKYQQKYLRYEIGEKHTPRTITNVDEYHFYYEVNEFYTDNLDKDVVKEFIRVAYQPYTEDKENKICGFFTDEPQLSRKGIPWSNVIPNAYKEEYNEDILPLLPQLFFEIGNYRETRIKFWRLVTILFSTSYVKQISDYLDKYNMKLTGHLVLEDDLLSQLTTNGAVMPCYEYFDMPGVDALFREPISKMSVLQVASVAHQLGKKQVLSESFALCGDGISFEELRYLYEYQMVRGANILCPHLEGYSLRGMRKFDRPPAMYYQQPWWKKYNLFTDMVSSIGMLLAEGRTDFDTLLLHPQVSAWAMYNTQNDGEIKSLSDKFSRVIDILEEKNILFDLGDEIIMERHATVQNGKILIGNQSYSRVILPPYTDMLAGTKELLDKFAAMGGEILTAEEVAPDNITDNKEITYTRRLFDDFIMHYFVNSTDETQCAETKVKGRYIDFRNKCLKNFNGAFEFAPFDSLVVIEEIDDKVESQEPEKLPEKKLSVDGEWKIEDISLNTLVVDKCDYYINGELKGKGSYILDAQTDALEMEKPVDMDLVFSFEVKDIPDKIYLATENRDADIYVNDTQVLHFEDDFFIDPAFGMINIGGMVREGTNTVKLKVLFAQSDKTYENIRKSAFFESERNKLSLDSELAPIYIAGDFEVSTEPDKYEELDRNAVRYSGEFTICKQREKISLHNINKNGYPFFAGEITLSREMDISHTNYRFEVEKTGINAIDVFVNDSFVNTIAWNPYTVDISEFLKTGKNKIKITIYNNLRNLMGPHHVDEGECYKVRPGCYFKKKWLFSCDDIKWNDDFCFIKTSVD